MSLELLHPSGLAALAALPLPILLHLARRTEQRVTPFAALAWIGRRQPPRQRIRLAEWLLLALRLALIVALAAWWAAPVWHGGSARADVVVLVAADADLARLTEPLPDGERRWLVPGFPSLDAVPPATGAALPSLLRAFDADLAADASLVVVVPEIIDGMDGGALQLGHPVRWIVVPARAAASMPTAAAAPPAITIALGQAGGSAPSAAVLRATVAAWSAAEPGRYRLDETAATAPPDPAATWLFAVDGGADAARGFVEAGGTALVLAAADSDAPVAWRDDDGRVLARERRLGRGRLVELAAPLTPSRFPAVLDPDFPTALRHLLIGAAPAPGRAIAAAVAPTRNPGTAAGDGGRPLQSALALAIALLFLLERMLANGARLRGAG